MSMDALIIDGTSTNLFFKELIQLYNSPNIEQVQLPKLKLNFRDYMLKYTQIRSSKLFTQAKQYWENRIEEYDFDAHLPIITNPMKIDRPKFVRLTKTIPTDKWKQIETKANQYNVGITSVVLYVYGHLLCRWSGYSKFCVNLTLFNRLSLHEEVNEILGDFTVLELFNYTRQKSTNIHEGITLVHKLLWNDIEHNLFDGVDYQRLIRKKLNIAQTQSLSPVVLTSMLGNFFDNLESLNGVTGVGYSINQTSQVYLDNKAYQTKNGFVAEWDYVEQLFDSQVIKQMHREYCDLIEYISEADWSTIIPVLDLSAQDKNLIKQANSYIAPIVNQTLVNLSLAGIQSFPKSKAVIDAKGNYTYKQIEDFSYHLGGYLHDYGLAEKNKLVGILSEKSHLHIVSTLGIMWAGAAYLPLHVDWPLGRIDEILEEGMVQTLLVSESEYLNCIKGSTLEYKYNCLIIEQLQEYIPKVALTKLPKPSLDDIAYVIFTSGSTGKPKGVTISHKAVVNTILAVNKHFSVKKGDKILALSALSFDLSVYDIFGPLAVGGTVVFIDQAKIKDPVHWYEMLVAHQVNIWNTVPQLMQLLVEYVDDIDKDLDMLSCVLMSGDWIPVGLPAQIKSLNNQVKVVSLGGATEGSIWSIWYDIEQVNPTWKSIPYGHAMPNQKMFVLNSFLEHCAVDVRGDIYIGGDGVAEGYWNNEELTNASFIQHESLGRLYRTGDLGKWKRDGYIEFEGRKDNQVKLNGYRVELEEISSRIIKMKGIEQALTLIQDNHLVTYVVPDKTKEIQTSLNTNNPVSYTHLTLPTKA